MRTITVDQKKLIDVQQYAKINNVSPQAVTKLLRANKPLKGVKMVLKFSRFYVLVME